MENENIENILINKMFTGKYLEDYNNIGHEIIYYFKPDKKNKSYIYITPHGHIKEEKGEKIKWVLLASEKKNGKYQIFAKVKVSKLLVKQNKKDREKDNYIYRNKYSDAHYDQIKKYKFGEKYLYNIYKQDYLNDDAVYATYEVEKIYTVKKEKNIVIDVNGEDSDGKCTIINISGKEYDRILHFKNENTENKEDKNKKNKKEKLPLNIGELNYTFVNKNEIYPDKKCPYNIIQEIIDKEELWEEIQVNEYKKTKNNDMDYDKITMISIIGKETDELVYSNMLYYYFNAMYNGKILFNYFLEYLKKRYKKNEILKKLQKINVRKKIEKEKTVNDGRIDLYAEAEYIETKKSEIKTINIVIENKINSMINGKDELGGQLNVYIKNYDRKKFLGIILVPNYNEDKIYSDPLFQDEEIKSKYIVVNYKTLYDFFDELLKENFIETKAREFFEDFKDALYIHTIGNKEKEFTKLKKAINSISKENIKYKIFVLQVCNETTKNKNKYYVGLTNNYDKRKKELINISIPKEDKKSKKEEHKEENKKLKNPEYNYLYNDEWNIIYGEKEDEILQFEEDELEDAVNVKNILENCIIKICESNDNNKSIEDILKNKISEIRKNIKKKNNNALYDQHN